MLITSSVFSAPALAQAVCEAIILIDASTSIRCSVVPQNQPLTCYDMPTRANAKHEINLATATELTISAQSSSGNIEILIDGPNGCIYSFSRVGSTEFPASLSRGKHYIHVGSNNADTATLTIETN